MKKIVILGGGGFIGGRLVPRLAEDHNNTILVIGRSAVPAAPLPPNVSYVSGSISDESFLREVINGGEHVLHLAHSTTPKTSFEDPIADIDSNLQGTVSVFKVAGEVGVDRLTYVSSGGAVYGHSQYVPVDEKHPTNPISPYGICKLAAEKYAQMYAQIAALPLIVVRPSNPYGPGQMGERGQGFIGSAINRIISHEPVIVFGERGTVRDYIYIEDVAEGIISAMHHGLIGATYNIGSGVGLDNMGVLEELVKLLPNGLAAEVKINVLPRRPYDVDVSILSYDALMKDSGWKPKVDIRTGLRLALDWAIGRKK